MTGWTTGFDADDTLWHTERAFRLTQARFAELLADHVEGPALRERLLDSLPAPATADWRDGTMKLAVLHRGLGLRARLPALFALCFVLPTLLGAVYFWLIASDRYVTEASFAVRAALGFGGGDRAAALELCQPLGAASALARLRGGAGFVGARRGEGEVQRLGVKNGDEVALVHAVADRGV